MQIIANVLAITTNAGRDDLFSIILELRPVQQDSHYKLEIYRAVAHDQKQFIERGVIDRRLQEIRFMAKKLEDDIEVKEHRVTIDAFNLIVRTHKEVIDKTP